MKKWIALISSSVILFSGAIIFSTLISRHLIDYRALKEEIVLQLNMHERLTTVSEYIPGNTIGEEKVKIWQTLENQASLEYAQAIWLSLGLVIFVLAFVGFNVLMYYKSNDKYRVYGFLMIFSSITFLFLALQSPFLEVMAYNKDLTFSVPIDVNFDEVDFLGGFGLGEFQYDYEQTFEGRIYYLYQNKSVLELIGILYTGGNYLVAVLVLFVSILFPLFKFVMSIIILSSPQKKSSLNLYRIIHNLAKWSMVDVFTAGIFLAYFAYTNMNFGVDTGSKTLVGMYYFLIFVALSINSGQYLKKAMKRAQGIPEGVLEVGFEVPDGALNRD